jgi:hypothetical protein
MRCIASVVVLGLNVRLSIMQLRVVAARVVFVKSFPFNLPPSHI